MCFSPALRLVLIMIKYLQICQRLCEEDCSQCGDSGDTVFSSCDWREWRYQPRPGLCCTVTSPVSVQSAGPGTVIIRSTHGQRGGERGERGPENNIGMGGCALHLPSSSIWQNIPHYWQGGSIISFSSLIKKIPSSPVASYKSHISNQ